MRRKDREITDFNEIVDVMNRCEVLRIGMVDGEGKPYIVPLTFGLDGDGEKVIFYFHSATAGRKMEILRVNPLVCFEMEAHTGIVTNESACGWTARYETVMGEGRVRILRDEEEKRRGLNNIMKRNGYKGEPEFNKASLSRVEVCLIEVDRISGKRNS